MADAVTVRATDGEPLDALVWRSIGQAAPAVQAVLAANPGLERFGPGLPDGTAVMIPAAAQTPAPAPLIQLWD